MWLFHQRFLQVSEQNFFSFRPWGWMTGLPQCGQAAFFLWCHQVSLQSLKWFTFLRPKVVSFYSAKNKKRPPTGNNSPVAVNVAVAQVLANIT